MKVEKRTEYTIFLWDFITTLDNINKPIMEDENYYWFAENEEIINKLEKSYKEFKNIRKIYFEELRSKIQVLEEIHLIKNNVWKMWKDRTLYCDFGINDGTITLHVRPLRRNNNNYWVIEIVGRKPKDKMMIKDFLKLKSIGFKREKGNWRIEKIGFEKNEKTAKSIIKISELILDYKSNQAKNI